MKKPKAVLLGLAITVAFFWFAYFTIGIAPDIEGYWGAVGLLCLTSVIIGVAWTLCLYLGSEKKAEINNAE